MITYQLYEAGFCQHCERMTLTTGQLAKREYPSICALIKHEKHGYILFDTGYSERFFQITQKFPKSLYRRLTPVTLKKSLKAQLLENNIQANEINYIIISHFHADHIGGLHDFPNAKFICHPQAVNMTKTNKGLKALLKGFLPELLPTDFYERLILLTDEIKLDKSLHPFAIGYALFGDQRLIAVPLPGHAQGHIGLYIKSAKDVFLVGDSCWHQETFRNLIYPSQLTYLIHDNKDDYINTIHNLHELYLHNPEIEILPSHCEHVRQQIRETIC